MQFNEEFYFVFCYNNTNTQIYTYKSGPILPTTGNGNFGKMTIYFST